MTSETADFVLARIIGSQPVNSKEGVILLDKNKTYSCGRHKENDIRCDNVKISGKHCAFLHYPNEVYVKDLDSNRGVYVNGTKLKPRGLIQLKENDLIGIGTSKKSSNDSSNFIYRLQKQKVDAQVDDIDVVDVESQFPEVRKRNFQSGTNLPPSKRLRDSDNNQVSPIQFSSTKDFESTSYTYKIGYSVPQSVPEDDIQVLEVINKKTSHSENSCLSECLREKIKFRNEEDRKKPRLSPAVCETLESETESSDTIIWNKNGTLSEDEEDTYEIEELNRNKNTSVVKDVKNSQKNIELLLHDDSVITKLSEERNRLVDFNYGEGTTYGNDAVQISNLNINSRPVVLDLEDETNIEGELLLHKPEKIAEHVPASPSIIDIDSDTSEATTEPNDPNENKTPNVRLTEGRSLDTPGTSIQELIDLDSGDSSLENECGNSLPRSKILGDEGFDSEGATDIEEELPLDEPETVMVNGFPDCNDMFTKSKEALIKNSRDPRTDLKDYKNNNTETDLKLSRNESKAPDLISERNIAKSSVENLRTSVKGNVTVQDIRVILNRFNIKSLKSDVKSSENETRETEITGTTVPDKKISTSETKSDELISQILEWNPIDFQIRSTGKKCSILKSYETYEKYSAVLKSHLIFEIAHKVKKGLDKHSTFGKCDVVKNSASKIIIGGTNSCLLAFYLYLKVSSSSSYKVPTTGDLILLEILRERIKYPVLGYVKNVTTISSENNSTQVICAVTTKFLDFNIYTSTVLGLHVVTGLLASLNMIQAMTDFKSSRLLPLILNPGMENYPPRDPLEQIILSPSSCLKPQLYYVSSDQAHAVMRISRVIENEEPKICVIEGPPGTGKTTVLIDTISNVLCKNEETNSKPRILVCAKSRTEVDEIVFRLAFVKTGLKEQGRCIKLVRIGDPETTNPELKRFTSQILAERHIDLGIREFLLAEEVASRREGEYQKKLSSLQSDYNELEIPSNAIKSHVLDACFEILKSGKKVREMPEEESSKLLEFVEYMILSEANVIACTLSTRLANKLDAIYRKTDDISVCIIDEATQIPEIEILKPLTYGVKTLVLLGDPFRRSIPHTYSNSKKQKKMDNTLFSRIKANYAELKNSPTFSLNRQFRINSNVMFWLNKFIYEENMKTFLPATNYPLLPYKVLNFFPHSLHLDEPLFVSSLISCIVQFAKIDRIVKPMSIGVILPTATSKSKIISEINTSLSISLAEKCDMFKIDVDTLSAFTNQERDVIIISCTKNNGNVEESVGDDWLYAAMTRVKHSLILYGTFRRNMEPSLLSTMVRSATPKISYLNIRDCASSELKKFLIRKRTG